jgi:hypothetical protein
MFPLLLGEGQGEVHFFFRLLWFGEVLNPARSPLQMKGGGRRPGGSHFECPQQKKGATKLHPSSRDTTPRIKDERGAPYSGARSFCVFIHLYCSVLLEDSSRSYAI